MRYGIRSFSLVLAETANDGYIFWLPQSIGYSIYSAFADDSKAGSNSTEQKCEYAGGGHYHLGSGYVPCVSTTLRDIWYG